MGRTLGAGVSSAMSLLVVVASCGRAVKQEGTPSAGQSAGGAAATAGAGTHEVPRGGDAATEAGQPGEAGSNMGASGGAAGTATCPDDASPCTPSGSGGTQPCTIAFRHDDGYLYGTNLTAHEGQSAVSQFGEATVVNGEFELFIGMNGTCSTFYYRFDTDDDGQCSDADDVRLFAGTAGPTRQSATITEGALGEVASCTDVPSGYDLAFTWGCFNACGAMRVDLLRDEKQVSATNIDLSYPDGAVGKGMAGLLEAGKSYELRYYRDCKAPWQKSFIAVEGRNVINLDPTAERGPSDCP